MNDQSIESGSQPSPMTDAWPPDYWACTRIIKRLQEFQDLVRHHSRFGENTARAKPLEALLPETRNTDPLRRSWLIETRINRLIPLVSDDLDRAEIATRVTWRIHRPRLDGKGIEWTDSEFDLILDYFEFKHPQYERTTTVLLRRLDEALGIYEALKQRAFWRMLNPITWIAAVLRAPVTLLERADLVDSTSRSRILAVYILFVQILTLLILAGYAGLEVPWNIILQRFLR